MLYMHMILTLKMGANNLAKDVLWLPRPHGMA